MEEMSRIFQSLSQFIEYFSLFIAIAGVTITFKGHRLAGTMIAVGSAFHAIGYMLLMQQHPDTASTAKTLLISSMYPGLLLLTAGICYLAFSLKGKQLGA